MNKLTKLLFSVISSVAIATSAFAGEFTVSGGVKATYTVLSNTGTTGSHALGKGLGISNEFSLSASGELDNGMTWSYAQDIDGATVQDDASLAFGTDYGTVKICVSECGLSTKYAFDNSAYGIGSDNGYGHGAATGTVMQYGKNISSYNNVQYHAPADLLPFSTTFAVGITPGGIDTNANASSHNVQGDTHGEMQQYKVTTSPIDGLTLSAHYNKVNDFADGVDTEDQLEEGGAYGIKYSAGNLTLGYGKSFQAPEIATAVTTGAAATDVEYYESTGLSLGYAVNDAVSVSYTRETSERNLAHSSTVQYDIEMDSIQVAYSLGGATLSLARADVENASYTQNSDSTETIIAMSFAF